MERNLDFLKGRIIAHRGYHDKTIGIPENSMTAFKRAVENDYIIELDVHILKDGEIVVFHDDDLNRMTGEKGKLKHFSYDEIKDIKLSNSEECIPRFIDVLKLVDGRVPIIIELKYDVTNHSLEEKLMEILKDYKGKYAIKSFNPNIVLYFKKNYPEVIRGQLASDFKTSKMTFIRKYILKNMLFNVVTKPDFISYDVRALPNKKVEKIRNTLPILVWTIKTKEELEKAKKYGDNFICENIDKIV